MSARRQEHDDSTHTVDTQPMEPGPDMADGDYRSEEYRGFKFGAAFFGWLIAVALTVLLAVILSAVAAAVGASLDLSTSQVEQRAGTLGIVGGVGLLVVLVIAYFTGGYVAGRLARFDGARQGFGAWLIGLVVTAVSAAIGAVFGTQYNVFQQPGIPRIPLPPDMLTMAGVIGIVVLLAGTGLAAILGGKAGQRYHTKIDRIAG